jgi:hypothetical protein
VSSSNVVKIRRTPLTAAKAYAISEDLVALCQAHEIVVGCHGDGTRADAVPEHLTYTVRVHKKRLQMYWIDRLRAVAEQRGAKLVLVNGWMEFR